MLSVNLKLNFLFFCLLTVFDSVICCKVIENKATSLPETGPVNIRNEKTGYYMDSSGYLDTYNSNNSYDWNDPNNRIAPSEPPSHNETGGYIIKPEDLSNIRKNFMYWYHDQGGRDGNGDFQKGIHAAIPQVQKNLNFDLPFFGFKFNYTIISSNGFLAFSDPPEHSTYPLVFPIKDWPKQNDPSFIGIFFSKCRIGKLRPGDQDPRYPGVYFRLEGDLTTRTDRRGVEIRERVKWDIREVVVGSDTFIPKHVIIATWKNMSFAGGIDNSLYSTNTFQMILATDEVNTYSIFNYAKINWPEAGGDATRREGGIPAYVGFNAGNGTKSFEYKPYSQSAVLKYLAEKGCANGFPGRHIFRIDEDIMLGTCN